MTTECCATQRPNGIKECARAGPTFFRELLPVWPQKIEAQVPVARTRDTRTRNGNARRRRDGRRAARCMRAHQRAARNARARARQGTPAGETLTASQRSCSMLPTSPGAETAKLGRGPVANRLRPTGGQGAALRSLRRRPKSGRNPADSRGQRRHPAGGGRPQGLQGRRDSATDKRHPQRRRALARAVEE